MLPFTAEAFFAVFEQYNRAIWPAQVIAYVLGIVALLLCFRPVPGGGRLIGAFLAIAWAWNGVAYHFMHFATINIAAPVFGVFFVLEALLLGWTGAIRGRIAFRFRADLFGCIGLTFVVFAMAVYPLVGSLAGHGWPRAPMFGVAPCPTTIFTMGMLLLTEGRTPMHLAVIPVLWSLVGGTAAWLLGVPEDLALPLAGIGGVCLLWARDRRQARA